MAFWIKDQYQNKNVQVSLGSWMAKLIASTADTNWAGYSSQAQTNLITFANRTLLQQMQASYPGLSRQINFNPVGLGIGTIFTGFSPTATYRPTRLQTNFIEPQTYNNSGNMQHQFLARGWSDISAAEDSNGYDGVSYVDWGFTPPPGRQGLGGDTIVSQPIKSDDRIYFEIEVTEAPKLVDSNGYAPAVDFIGRTYGNHHASGGLQLTIAPENWYQSAEDPPAQGRSFNLDILSKGMINNHGTDRTGSGNDLDRAQSWPYYKTNVSVKNDSDVGNLIQDGDIIMIAIDGVADSTGENRLFWGVNGVWAKADSSDQNFGVIASHTTFDPADDNISLADALRPGVSLVTTEDPYYLYLSPLWSDSSVGDGTGATYTNSDKYWKNYASQAVAGGTYRYLDANITIKTGTDVTYTPPTSGRGYTFKAH